MIELITRAGVREVIDKYGLSAKKKLGQHFLVDNHVLQKILNAADVNEDDVVLEIGPGIGALTQGMLRRGAEIVAVELDKQLVPVLESLFSGAPLTIVQDDILRVDLHTLLAPYEGCNLKVIANLPYYITTPVILYLLESGIPFESITILIQKEVAQRMAANPGQKDYGSLTLAVQYYADVEIAAYVPVNSFMPRPGVDSAVITLTLLKKPRTDYDKDILFKVIRAAFNQRRKTMVNALESAGLGTKEQIASALTAAGLDVRIRGEALSLAQFEDVTRALGESV